VSASNWTWCPGCQAEEAVRATAHRATFREDYQIYGAETGTVTVEYLGECHSCGLTLEFKDQRAIPVPPVSEPRRWAQIPAGWEVQAPSGAWYEVVATRAMHSDLQLVTLRSADGAEVESRRPAAATVTCRPGARASAEVENALALFGDGATIREDKVS